MSCSPTLVAGMPVLGSLLPTGDAECSPIDRLNIRTIIYQRALEAMIAFETDRFQSLDVPAGDQACQIRALQFCLLDLEGLDVVKRTIKARIAALEELACAFAAMDQECESQVAAIEREKLVPLADENRAIAKERGEALKAIHRGDPRKGEIAQKFAERFQAVTLKKQPILREIAELQQACRVKQKRMVEDDALEMSMNSRAVIVVQSYLVSLVSVDVISKEMGAFTYQIHSSPKMLGEGGFVVPTDLLIDTVNRAKEAICSDSIKYVQQEAALIGGEGGARLQKYVANPRFVEKKERSELPFFHMTQVIFQRAMEQKIPVLFKARNIKSHPLEQASFACSVLFKSDGSSYQVSPVLPEDLKQRGIVIEGFSRQAFEVLKTQDYVEATLQKSGGLLRLIDLNTAQHGQYTDQTISTRTMFRKVPGMEAEEEGMLLSLFDEAVGKGFSLRNPDQYCIDHVFCDLLANQRAG